MGEQAWVIRYRIAGPASSAKPLAGDSMSAPGG